MQTLWQQVSPSTGTSNVYNGAVTACSTLAAMCVALLVARVKMDWEKRGELVLSVLSFGDCIVLLVSAFSRSIWVVYGCYVVFACIYTALITIISAEIAVSIEAEYSHQAPLHQPQRLHQPNLQRRVQNQRPQQPRPYAFLFGFNTFMALGLQSILTFIVNTTLQMDIRPQFVVYGAFFAGIGGVFCVFTVLRCTGLVDVRRGEDCRRN